MLAVHSVVKMNQSYHAKCELLGTLNDGIDIAERYIIAVTHAILVKHVRTTSHVDDKSLSLSLSLMSTIFSPSPTRTMATFRALLFPTPYRSKRFSIMPTPGSMLSRPITAKAAL